MSETDKSLVYENLRIHPMSRVAYVEEHEITLTRMEFDVLYFLAANPDIAFTKEQIYEAVRDIIYRLRTKLKISNIRTLHGYGYKFSTDNGKDNIMS